MRSGARWRADRGPTQRGVQPVRNLARAVRQNQGRRDGAAPQAIYSRRFKIARLVRIVGLKIKSYALERADERAALARLAKARAVTDIISIEGAATRFIGTAGAERRSRSATTRPPRGRRFRPVLRRRRAIAIDQSGQRPFSARGCRHPIGAQLNYAYKSRWRRSPAQSSDMTLIQSWLPAWRSARALKFFV